MQKNSGQKNAFVVATIIAVISGLLIAVSNTMVTTSARFDYVLEQRINPNFASVEQLQMLDGVGPVKAQAIVDYRNAQNIDGQIFADCNDLKKVSGIGPKTVKKISDSLVFK